MKRLVERHGWEAMGDRIPIRCFILNPSVKSSLTFLRKTPWARKKVENWFVEEVEDTEQETEVGGERSTIGDGASDRTDGGALSERAAGDGEGGAGARSHGFGE